MTIRWQDWMTVLLGAWLLASPWQLDFALNHAAMGNACGVGVALIVFNLMAVGSCVNCLAVWQIIDAVRKSKK